MKPLADLAEVLSRLRPGASVVLHSACSEPRHLARELARCAASLSGVTLYTLMPMGEAPYAAPATRPHLALATFFPGKGLRAAAGSGRARVMRVPLSAIPPLFEKRVLKADLLLLQLSPPDANGRMSLGLSVDYMHAVLSQRPTVVAEINPHLPYTLGDTLVDEGAVDFVVDSHDLPQPVPAAVADEVDGRIADNVAGLIGHRSVIQTGIGSLPDLVMARLGHLSDLGVHSGVITEAVLPLIERGVVTNAAKKGFRGACVTTMAAGSQRFYDALHRNPAVLFHPCSLTHDVAIIAGIERFCAINSALQVDLAGRANAESVDGRVISGPGGLPDFARGASLAKQGASILALRATSKDATRSNIVTELAADAPVSIDADCIDYVVTEHGVARLRGLDAAARAKALAAVAHPDFRAALAGRVVA